MEKGELIAEGRTAEVYAWGDKHVLKLFRSWWPLESVEFEARIGRAVYEGGVAAPEVGEIIKVEGRRGLIYQRIDGPDMEVVALAEPQRVRELATTFAHLHATLHSTTTLMGFPSQRRRFIYNISERTPFVLDQASRQYALDILHSLPDGESVCHGDLHPGNVIMSPDGPRIIDWDNACVGSPLTDFARSILLLQNAHLYFETEPNREMLLATISSFAATYLAGYVAETGADAALIARWQVPAAAARLHEGIEIEEESLRAICTPH
jgi:uncharacterized protein (TIGR02172 family)